MNSNPGGPAGFPCRFVIHRLEGRDHLDLFIELPYQEKLLTYEVSIESIPGILQHNTGLWVAREPGRLDGDCNDSSFIAEKKLDHRKIYMNYQGNISGNRGLIEELKKGLIYGVFLPKILICPDFNDN